MFHQVFIYDPTEDEDPSRGLNLEQSKNESPHTVKEENPSESATMGFVQTEDLKIAVKELKSEQQSLISTQQVMKSDTETPQVNLETKNILNVTSCTNAVFPMNQTRQEFILPVADEQEIQPQPLTSSPAQFIIQEPQETTAVQSLGPSLISLLPQPALIGPMQLLSAPMTETGAGIAPATQVLDSAISQASTLKIDPSSCLSDVDMSEEQEGGSTVMINSEIKIENEELPVKSADLEDTQIKNIQVKFQDDGMNSSTICQKLVTKIETTGSSSIAHRSPSSQRSIKIINKNYNLYNINSFKDCALIVNDSPSEYITPELISDRQLNNLVASCGDESIKGNVSGGDNSDSDWEREYFGINSANSKQKGKLGGYSSNSKDSILSKDPSTKIRLQIKESTNNDLINLHTESQLLTHVKAMNENNSSRFKPNVSHRKSTSKFQNNSNKKIQHKLKCSAAKPALVVKGHSESKTGTVYDGSLQASIIVNNENKTPLFHSVQENSKVDDGLNFKKILPKPSTSSYTFSLIKAHHTESPLSHDSTSVNSSNAANGPNENSSELSDYLYRCNECSVLFEDLKQYLYHKQACLCFIKTPKVIYQCDICGKVLANDETLKEHKNWHTNARPLKCFYCEEGFNSRKARAKHCKLKHRNQKSKRFLCSFCGYSNSKKKDLLAHEGIHILPEGAEIPKPFVCKECGKRFRCYNGLRGHLKFHSSVSFICSICDKGFKTKANLLQHMITHSDARPITCLVCGDKFKRMTHLRQHKYALHGEVVNQ